MKWRRIFTLLVKEFQELFRNRKMMAIIFVSPIAQLLIFGYAAIYDIKSIPLGIRDHDHSDLSRKLIRSLEASGSFTIDRMLESDAQIDTILQRGEVWSVLDIPQSFAQDVAAGKSVAIGAALDASNSNSAGITANYLIGAIMRFNDDILASRIAQSAGKSITPTGLIANKIRVWYNPDMESRNFNVPAMVVQILVLVTLMLTSMAIVREKEFGTMEQLIVTPIRPSELILGKALPYAFIGMVDIALICAVAVFYFQVPLVGSLTLLFGTSLIFMLSTLAVGLLISTISATQQQAMISAFFFMMPAILLSGFAFPLDNMPVSIQYLTYLNPLRYFIVIIRSIFLKGGAFMGLLDQIIPLFVLGVSVLALAAARFKKRSN
ncbi:MAG: ABC transporter permease [Candidatus Zixiibacteriota bacterium]